MVTILDMVTGELILDDAPAVSTPTTPPAEAAHGLIAPRLQTVEEATATERRPTGMPADLAVADLTGLFHS